MRKEVSYMPNFVDGSYGSRAGEALISKVLAGRCKMKYTRAAVGKGVLPNGKSPKIMTEAMDFVMSANIASISNPVNGECQVSVQIKSDDVREGFYTTNVVLFAEDPDIGEILFTYLLLEESPEWISSSSSSIGKVVTFDIIAAVGEIESVSAVIDPESIATIENVKKLLKEHDEDQKAHRSY